jgi:leader peptidase (prepilin peptidase) / N-methyltransferase
VWIADFWLTVLAGGLGAILGSFLNVCVYRLPRDESVVRPRSRCPGCGAMIAWYDNIPVVSWLLLRGRCRHCHTRISVQYPLVEATVALVWAAAMMRLGPTAQALSAAVFVTLLVGILLTDAQHFLIPNEFSLGGLGAGLALSFVTDIGPLRAALGAATGYALLGGVKAVGDLALGKGWIGGKEIRATLGDNEPITSMGGGDVKMMAMIGAFLGWQGVLLTVFLGALAGTIVYLPFMFRKQKPLVPFGIYLAIGACVTLLFGSRLVAWYAALVAP